MRNIFVDGVVLKRDDWYMNLLHWMYGIGPERFKSLCPLFWSVIGSLLILPIYMLMLGIVKLVTHTYKYKLGEIILDTIGYIAKWIFYLSVLLLITASLGCMISGILVWWMYGIIQEASVIILMAVAFIFLFVVFAAIFIYYEDKISLKKNREKQTIIKSIHPTNNKVKKVASNTVKPFRMFGLFIVATYHKVCPLITWK